MTPQQLEQLGRMKAELDEMRNLALSLHERAVQLRHELDRFSKGCPHLNAQDRTMMGAEAREKYCPDCGEAWEEPWEKKAEGE